MDIVKVRNQVVTHLTDRGFQPRDGDGTDFQRGSDDNLRFKVGTSYQEVAITYWRGKDQFGVTRITNDGRVQEALDQINAVIPDAETQVVMVDDEVVWRHQVDLPEQANEHAGDKNQGKGVNGHGRP